MFQKKGISLIQSVTKKYNDMVAKLESGIAHCNDKIQKNTEEAKLLQADTAYHQMHIDQATSLIAHLKQGLGDGRAI